MERPRSVLVEVSNRFMRIGGAHTVIDTDSSTISSLVERLCEDRNVGEVDRGCLGELGREGEFASLVTSDASERVEQDGALELWSKRWVLLDLDERVCDHHLTHNFVGGEAASAV